MHFSREGNNTAIPK